MSNADEFLALGEHEIYLNRKTFKVSDGRKLRELIDNVNAEHHPYKKFPRKPKENNTQYLERFNEHYGIENIREEGESDDKYLTRVSKSTFQEDELKRIYDILKAIAAYTNQEHKVTPEGFEDASLDDVDIFIQKVFKLCKIG